jgi:hypothetical protein
MTKQIRDRRGQVIGYIDDLPHRLQLRDRTGSLRGWYNKKDDRTYQRNGALFGYGDQLMRLLN